MLPLEIMAEPLTLWPAKKLKVLRALDIFHPWKSLDEVRFCRRCGAQFTGREIKVFHGRHGRRYRLECPTEACPSVPIEWIVPETTMKVEAQHTFEALLPYSKPKDSRNVTPQRPRLLAWLGRRQIAG
jgi:hypothetical protein